MHSLKLSYDLANVWDDPLELLNSCSNANLWDDPLELLNSCSNANLCDDPLELLNRALFKCLNEKLIHCGNRKEI